MLKLQSKRRVMIPIAQVFTAAFSLSVDWRHIIVKLICSPSGREKRRRERGGVILLVGQKSPALFQVLGGFNLTKRCNFNVGLSCIKFTLLCPTLLTAYCSCPFL